VGENLPQVRRSVSGQRLQYTSMGIGFVMGLAAHVGGYLLRSWMTTEPLLLVADLLYALGWALWTGVVVVVVVHVVPEAKRRQLKGHWRPTGSAASQDPQPQATRRRGTTSADGEVAAR
jgi:hypothetical protein